jgi:formylglycine-generating enzyme required for sulfatase activity
VLEDPAIGGFQVQTLIDQPSHKVSLEIESFYDNRKRDDLLLLYFSGHGIKDADGRLYFATIDTQLVQHNVRRATAVGAHFVNEVMSRSRSRRQVLLLDCCYSGAFKEGMLAKGDKRVGAGDQFEGQGRVVLTASDALQYSFEGERVEGEGIRSVFTSTLVHGLETGEADMDGDANYSIDDVYDYIYARVSDEHPEQKPMKMGYVEGKIFIGNNPRPRAAELPPELQESLGHFLPMVRKGAVEELGRLLAANNKGLVMAAQAALTSVARQDDSLQVRTAAEKCLAAHAEAPAAGAKQAADQPAAEATKRVRGEEAQRERERLEADRLAAQKAESVDKARANRERAEREKAEADRVAQEKAGQAQRERERVEAERLARKAREKAEAERLAGEKAEQERLAREKVEPERRAWVTHVDRGNALKKKGNVNAAIAEYHEAIRLDPQNDVPRIKLADALDGIGKLDEAVTECRQALRLKPDSTEAHYRLGLLLYEKYYVENTRKDLSRAVGEYGEALRLNPKHAQAHHSLAEALQKKGDGAGALEHCRIASELEPKNSAFRANYKNLAKAEAKRAAENAEAERLAGETAARERLAPGTVRENPRDGQTYVWIPPGTFMMGCSPGDTECQGEEKPSHQVTISKGFWMGQTPVTVAAYKRFAGETNAPMPPPPYGNPDWKNQRMPIVYVTWDEAQAYCKWAGGRLPTEAEWEYAARAGSTEARYGPLDKIAWHSANSGLKPHEVGQKRPNRFGLYDVLGNVWEWVSDWYDAKYYQNSPATDPQGPLSGRYGVRRGGGYNYVPEFVRVSLRGRGNPGTAPDNVGFRCVAELNNP